MSVTIWIVLAFALGVLFGRLTAHSATGNAGGPTGIGASAAAGPAKAMQFGTAAPVLGNPNGAYRVTLLDSGPNKINTIKVIRSVTRLDLKGAKDMADAAPRELIRVDTPEQARAVAQAFQGVATVRLDGPVGGV